MLNTDIKLGSNSQTVKFNAPSHGMMQRSHPRSVFVRFQKDSAMEKWVFPRNGDNPYIAELKYDDKLYDDYRDTRGRIEITVLQILIFGNDQYLVEVVEPKYLKEEE